ncbi:alanyl-tRNA editing protein [uncultured Acidaminococcus sp.]|uniref:alanyl-tRNA editing protein n=1 Tax=uncultured Acidaminococcus sp. TaxID=352152 RepID=UPI002942A1C6|nr:alanyl-tRNA editing protein [uncultured Acidaminococcus sp.]
MTEKLYENDSLLQSCQATVVSCEKKEEHYEVILDRTVLFPEGGGQLSDQGWLDKVPVFYASEEGTDVRHWTREPLEPGKTVVVKLDWPVRLDRMQQHCGEHILSYAFWKTCGANNVGFHMNEDSVFIDLDQEIDEEKAKNAEWMANECLWANEPISLHYVDASELGNYPLRKKNEKLKGTVRLVDIKNGDICTCCGTHPPYTGMVGSIQIIRFVRHKGGSRIEFICGNRALRAMHERNRILEDTSNFLSVKAEDVLPAVEKLHQEILDLRGKVREKTQELIRLRLPEKMAQAPVLPNGTKLLVLTLEGTAADGKSAMKLASAQPGVLAAVFTKEGDRLMYQFALSEGAEGDCRACCAKANELFGGRGGGRPQSAQGGGTAGADWEEKVKELVEGIRG